MSAQQQLLARYGEPNHAYVVGHCILWPIYQEFPWFPAHSFLINVDFQQMLRKAFQLLEKAGIHTEIKTYDGCYNDRTVRGSSSISLHAWAAAIDMNAADNPMTTSPDSTLRHGKWSPEFIQIMKSAGISFGGDFGMHTDPPGRADPMHWAILPG